MFIGVELTNYRSLTEVKAEEIKAFQARKKSSIDDLGNYIVGQIGGGQILDAKRLASKIFPEKKYDIFLSHSHKDEQAAIEFAISMKKIGVSVFVDSCVWGYVGDLLKKVNDEYSGPVKTEDSTIYDMERCNQVAANLFMMLSAELNKMIDASEFFVFLRSGNSIPVESYDKFESIDRTFSPWVFSELAFSRYVRCQDPGRDRDPVLELNKSLSASFESFTDRSAIFSYEAFNAHLPELEGRALRGWYTRTNKVGGFALDELYCAFDLETKFRELIV